MNGKHHNMTGSQDDPDVSQIDLPQDDGSEIVVPTVSELRASWNALLSQPFYHGQNVFIVPKQYIERALTLEVATIEDLSMELGSLDFTSLVDADGNLYPEGEEPVESMAVSEAAFDELLKYSHHRGLPIKRQMLQLSDDKLLLERFQPVFIIHTISKGTPTTRYGAHHDRYAHTNSAKPSLLLSQTSTFSQLIDAVAKKLYKDRPVNMRLWVITADNVDDIPPTLTPLGLIDSQTRAKLVCPNVLDQSLSSQGITSSRLHVVAEIAENGSHQFPIDNYLNTLDLDSDDPASLLHSGGHLGLTNLGNTCYMNSALQCLVHIPELNNYFFYDLFKRDLNKLNPLGCKGEIATSFSGLLHKLFDASSPTQTCITPRDFKYTVGRYSSMFHGYQQQDSQEFTSWLLDTLHEDLNRIQKKPYLEKPELKDEEMGSIDALKSVAETCWQQHKMRNDSVIVDLFTGLYQSTLVCPTCEKKSVTFDPFNDVTLPLPQSVAWYHTFTIVDLRENAKGLLKLEVELQKTANFDDLIDYLSKFLKVESSQLFLFEIFRDYIYRNFQEDSDTNKFMPISEVISSSDIVCVYIIPHDPEEDIIVPVVNVVQDEDVTYQVSEPFAFPLFIVLSKGTEALDYDVIKNKLIETSSIFTTKKLDLEPGVKPDLTQLPEETKLPGTGELQAFSGTPQISITKEQFHIRVHDDDGRNRFGSRFRSIQRSYNAGTESTNIIHIPLVRPAFGKLPLLASKLPQKSPAAIDLAPEKDSDLMVITPDESDDFVLVDNPDIEPTAEFVPSTDSIQSLQESSLDQTLVESQVESVEGSDSDSNWGNVSPLMASNNAPQSEDHEQTPGNMENVVENQPILVTARLCLVMDWASSAFEEYFAPDNRTWDDIPQLSNPQLEKNKRRQKLQEKLSVSLTDCLRNFSSPEVLGEQDLWYCPRCKDHKRATKTIQIWSTGDILTIHLKRFQTSRSFSDKLNMVVDFPIDGLDISEFVTSKESGDNLIYDLIAVDNHYGGLGGGHYTSAAKNFRDNRWYYFDDSRVTPIDDPTLTITSAAYLLFYRKRSTQPFVGGAKLETLLTEGRKSFEDKFKRSREQRIQILQESEMYRHQIVGNDNELLLSLSDSCANLNFKSLDNDDLYSDSVASSGDGEGIKSGLKNLRSPATAQSQSFEFENQRKQRLISKDCDEPRSVNINLGLSSSLSNLASPEASSDEDQLPLGG